MQTSTVARDDGYRGIWYSNQPSNDAYRYKYSGGFATYPQQHIPIACERVWRLPPRMTGDFARPEVAW